MEIFLKLNTNRAAVITLLIFSLSLLLTSCDTNSHASVNKGESSTNISETGFLVIAPDRGYAGNQKVRLAFNSLKEKRYAQLVFATDERMQPYLSKALKTLKEDGAKKIIILPVFLSASHPKLSLFRSMLQKQETTEELIYARPFGGSYLAVELLADRLQNSDLNNEAIIIAGHGATTSESGTPMYRDLQRIAEQALESIGKENKVEAVIWPGGKYSKTKEDQEKAAWDWVKNRKDPKLTWNIMPFHMGEELDGMMNFNASLERGKPDNMSLLKYKDNEADFYSLWMLREANRYSSPNETKVGIVFNAHGSDFHWNQTMRDAVANLEKEIPMEFAFSMADSEDLRKAVKRLEDRGVGVIVIVRVFGMRTSFRHSVERLIGMDIDAPELCVMDESASMPMEGAPPQRLRTSALVVTEGGLADSPLFAKALFDRARKLSSNKKDTVIVVAHGKGQDEANKQWLKVLESLTNQIKTMSDGKFKDVKYQTWREDWEDKRGVRINAVKKMVKDAQQDGGTAIIIPARTTGEGPTKRFLGEVSDEMNYKTGKGFAPHPLFPKWIESQMQRGLETLEQTRHVWYPALPIENTQQEANK